MGQKELIERLLSQYGDQDTPPQDFLGAFQYKSNETELAQAAWDLLKMYGRPHSRKQVEAYARQRQMTDDTIHEEAGMATYRQALEAVITLIKKIGDDPEREGLRETPLRMLEAFNEIFCGYEVHVPSLFKVFEQDYDEMVVLKDIEMYSTCEHHMLPFVGKAHVGYIPNGKVIGISKLARIVEAYSRRLQIQERICQQVTDCLMEHLEPLGAACIIEAKHFCMCSRGVNKQDSIMVTSSMKGAFREDLRARSEFLSIIGG